MKLGFGLCNGTCNGTCLFVVSVNDRGVLEVVIIDGQFDMDIVRIPRIECQVGADEDIVFCEGPKTERRQGFF